MCDKSDYFNFPIRPFTSSNIPAVPIFVFVTSVLSGTIEHGLYYDDSKQRHMNLAQKVFNQGYNIPGRPKAFKLITVNVDDIFQMTKKMSNKVP